MVVLGGGAVSYEGGTPVAIRAGGHLGRDCSEAGSCLRLIDSCVTQFKAQGPSRTCDESKEEEEKKHLGRDCSELAFALPITHLRSNPFRKLSLSLDTDLRPSLALTFDIGWTDPPGLAGSTSAGIVRSWFFSSRSERSRVSPPAACFEFGVEGVYFTEMCSGSEAGSYLRLIDLVYHSTLGWKVIKKKKKPPCSVV